ncbi:MAG TPA: ATP-binding protein [Saprospiraceae bacterium]|nr:ATP-binding protein [Saprospiraceae bacterium]HMQ84306.1 ATP-binding protein [Saprospiraceae bacterium]
MKRFIPIFLLVLANILVAQPDSLLKIENHLQVNLLDKWVQVFEDSTETLTFETVRQASFQANFLPLNNPTPSNKPHRAYWLKTRFIAADSLNDWLLLLKNPTYETWTNRSVYTAGNLYVDAYLVKANGEFTHLQDGFNVPKSKRSYYQQPLLNTFPFSLAKGDTLTAFIRVHNPNDDSAGLLMELRPQALEIPFGRSAFNFSSGVWIGVTFILALICFFFFLADRDVSNLYFSLFSFCLMLHYSILHPEVLFVSWFIPEKPWLAEYSWMLLTSGLFILFILFGRSFVNLKQQSLLLDKVSLGLVVIIFLSTVTSMLSYGFSWGINLSWVGIVTMLIMIILALRIGFFPGRLNKIFALGAVCLMLFSGLGFLHSAGYFKLFLPWPIGQMGLMVIYTYGLAYKLQLKERARSEAQRVIELDAVKSRFFANISHEFRTPLTLILGPLKKAQEQVPVSEQEALFENGTAEIHLPVQHISMMRRNAERLGQLIDQLLDLSKLENGSMKLQLAEGDLVAFLRAMILSFESLAERRQIHFQTAFPASSELTFFDRDKLEKIIVNLLSNAFKYTPEKGKVSVKTVLEKGRLKVSVEDSGPGISDEELDKVFERFYQVEGTETQGTGIGLSLVKELVELHRGQITVESAPGKGSIFKVNLPITKAAFNENEIVVTDTSNRLLVPSVSPVLLDASYGANQPAFQTNNSHPLLLIVEDNPDLRRFIGETMAHEYQILTAENGKLGFAAALEHTPDLIVSDVMMPEMDGFELCQYLKTDERTSHIPVILLTAKAGQQHKIEGLETGADDYLTKPFDETELLVRAKNLVEQRKKLRDQYDRGAVLMPGKISVTSADERFLKKVCEAIEANMDNEFFSVEDLASAVAFSRSQLHRKLKTLTGKSPTDLIREFRLTRAKELLEKGHGNVSEVAIEVGYSSLSYFTRSFKAEFGVLPSEV